MKPYSQVLQDLSNQPHKWFVSGAAGYVGLQLTSLLLSLDQKVVAVDDFSSSVVPNEDVLKAYHFDNDSLEVIRGDVRDAYAMYNAMKYRGIQHVVHLAAMRSVPRSYEDPVLVADVNIMGTLNLAKEAIDLGVDSFVYASSSSVYGINVDFRQGEWLPCNPISPYSKSKYAAEQLIGAIDRQATQVVGLRFFNIYGPNQDGWNDTATVIPKWVDRLVMGESIEVYGNSGIQRDFVHIQDVLQGIIRASLFSNFSSAEVINIGSGKTFTLAKIIDKIDSILRIHFEKTDSKITIDYLEERIGDVPHTCADIGLARTYLGYNPLLPLEEGLKSMIWSSMLKHKPSWFKQ